MLNKILEVIESDWEIYTCISSANDDGLGGQLNQNRGLTQIRLLSQEGFEKLYPNDIGFRAAYLAMSSYGIWGASECETGWVLEVFLDLSEIEGMVAVDFEEETGRAISWSSSDEFDDEFCTMLANFYDNENMGVHRKNSNLHLDFKGVAKFPWLTPQIVIVYVSCVRQDPSPTFALMENSKHWEEDDELLSPGDYVLFCADNYAKFSKKLTKEFDQDGNYIGKVGEIPRKGYKPKN